MDEETQSKISAISQGQFNKIQSRRLSLANQKIKDQIREQTTSVSPDRGQEKAIKSVENTEDEIEEVEEISYHSDKVIEDEDLTKLTFEVDEALNKSVKVQDGLENTQDSLEDLTLAANKLENKTFEGEDLEDKETKFTQDSKYTTTAEQEIEQLLQKIDQEKSQRQKLQYKIKELKMKSEANEKLFELNKNNQFSNKMVSQDMRNLMQSPVNYQTHCDFTSY